MLHTSGSAVRLARWLAVPLVLSAISVPLAPNLQAQSASFQPIGFLAGGTNSLATGVNAFGTVVTGSSGTTGSSGNHAFRWVDGTMSDLGVLNVFCGATAGTSTLGLGVSADGSTIVGSAASGFINCQMSHPFRWTAASGLVDLGGIPNFSGLGDANAVNADGSVVVGYSRHFTNADPVAHNEAFRWVNGAMTGLGYLLNDDFPSSKAFGVNADGSVVVGSSRSDTGTQAFRWVGGTMTGLGYLAGAGESHANAVSADGAVVVGASDTQAFRWINGAMTGLGMLPGGSSSEARAVSADGNIVAGTSMVSGRNFAVRWTPTEGMQSIEGLLAAAQANINGWQLTVARAVSADGSAIVGEGIDPNGRAQGWMVRFARGACDVASQLGDFNGDARADLLFRRNDGNLFLYLMNGFQILSATALGNVGAEWRLSGVGDFNGDGKADILFRRPDGSLALYLMNGAQVLAAQVLGNVGVEWDLAGVADFNGDGKADMLFRRKTDGMLALYLMNGFQVTAAQLLGSVGPEFSLAGVRDFNGDGRADMLFRRTSDGLLSMYLMNGFQVLGAQVLGNVGVEWRAVGVADFNGDGKADILFRRLTDGLVSMYLMDGFQVLGAQVLGNVGTEWNLSGVGDLNGDGRGDMVFRRTDGTLSVYLMNGLQVTAAQVLGSVGVELNGCYGQPPAMVAQTR